MGYVMFYFGGMTLGYLEPPAKRPPAERGGNVAAGGLERPAAGEAPDRLPGIADLIRRANWFSLYS